MPDPKSRREGAWTTGKVRKKCKLSTSVDVIVLFFFLIGFVLHGVHTEVYPMVTQLNVRHEQITTKERENWSGQFKGRKKIVQVGQIVQGEPMRESRVVKVICPAECIEMRTAEEMLPCFFVRASKATLAG